ncbi:peptide chain release factor N(5)-glutamine methyltransferase [Lacinutrix undariae]
MKLKTIQQTFHEQLDTPFGSQEVDSFFYLLIEHYLGLRRITLALEPQYEITETEAKPLFLALERLKNSEPIQYIVGETEFYGLPFLVNPYTLIPRPETEELVEWIIDSVKNRGDVSSEIKILDIGTGTGCIAISLAKQLPNAKVYALDVSAEALKMAKKNANLNTVDVTFFENNILTIGNQTLQPELKFDIIVSNPPYVRELEKQEMKTNVLAHEPHLALFVENDEPLVFYKAISQFAKQNLKANGQLFFEINEYLGQEMITMLHDDAFKNVVLKQDIFKKDRMIKGHIN